MSSDEIKNLKKTLRDYQKELKKNGKKAVLNSAKILFKKYPDLEAIGWYQYTPGFNDGDPCYFRVGSCYLSVARPEGISDNEWEDILDESNCYDGDTVRIDTDCLSDDAEKAIGKELIKDVNAYHDDISELDSALETIFGNNVSVTITRNSVEIEDYDCGY